MRLIFKKSLGIIMSLCLMLLVFGIVSVNVNAADTTKEITSFSELTANFEDDIFKYQSFKGDGTADPSINSGVIRLYQAASGKTSGGYIEIQSLKGKNYYLKSFSISSSMATTIDVYVINELDTEELVASNSALAANGTYTYSSANKFYGVKVVCKGTSSKTRLYVSALSITYEKEAIESAMINITNPINSIMLDTNHTFVAEKSNVEGEYVWNSENPGVATIENGVLTPVSTGKTVIKASIGEVESNSVEVVVYPNNEDVISVAKALEIAQFTILYDLGSTPYEYKTIGVVADDGNTKDQFILNQGSDNIVVHTYDHGQISGEKILVTGMIGSYSGNPQFVNKSTFSSLYTVTFNSNGGSVVQELVDVPEGTKIDKPVDPVKEGHSFVKWMNGKVEWDFENDLVEENLTLTANWLNNELLAFQANLNTIEAYMSLGYTYSSNQGKVSDELTASMFTATSNSYTDFQDVTSNSTAQYKGTTAKNGTAIQLRTSSNTGIVTTKSGGNIKKVTIVWKDLTSDGKKLDIYGKNEAYTSAGDLFGEAKGTFLGSISKGTSTELVIENDYTFIGLRSNNGAIYIESITIEYASTVYSDVDFRIRCGVNAGLEALANTLEGATYGLEVRTNSKTVCFDSEELGNDAVNSIIYKVVDLGDVLNNKDRLDLEFSVRAYVEYESVKYYSESEKTYSLVNLVKEYNVNQGLEVKEAVSGLVQVLTGFGKVVE